MAHQEEKPNTTHHVELARQPTSDSFPVKKEVSLPRTLHGKPDAAQEILQGERVEMTDEQVSAVVTPHQAID
jgi:hypothetical protein